MCVTMVYYCTDTGVLVLQYLQSVTAKLSLGAEVLFQKMPGMELSVLSLAANYRGTDWEAIGKIGMHQWSLCKNSIELQYFPC